MKLFREPTSSGCMYVRKLHELREEREVPEDYGVPSSARH